MLSFLHPWDCEEWMKGEGGIEQEAGSAEMFEL